MVVTAGRSMQNFTADEAQYEEAYDESGMDRLISKLVVNYLKKERSILYKIFRF